jgi:DNA-binding beta-propeller fold protein YncE
MSSRDSRGAAGSARSTVIVVVSAALAFATSACSGGSEGDGDAGAAVALWFPPGSGLMTLDSLTVRGGASNPSTIAAIRVNGVVTTTASDFAEWEAVVPLAMGPNPVIVESEDNEGQVDTVASVTITRTPFDRWQWVETAALDPDAPRALVQEAGGHLSFLNLETGARDQVLDDRPILGGYGPLTVALDIANRRALITEVLDFEVPRRSALYEIDLATGARTVVSSSDDGIGSGEPLMYPFVLAIDNVHGRAVVLDRLGDWDPPPAHAPAIMAVDLATGDRTVLSGNGVGAGMEFADPLDLVLDPGGDLAYVLDEGHGALLSVDLSTGARTLVASGLGSFRGTAFPMRDYLELDAANHRALVLNKNSNELRAVDLSTGDHMVVADLLSRNSPEKVSAFLFDGPRDRVIFHAGDAFMALDLTTGERHRISNAHVGAGPAMEQPSGVTVNRAGDRAYVTVGSDIGSEFGGGVMAIDLTTSTRRLAIAFDEETRLEPNTPYPTILDEDRGRLLIGDVWRSRVMEVALETGERAIVWDAAAAFPEIPFVRITDLALYGDELLVAVTFRDGADGAVCAVALDSGTWRILSGLGDPRVLAISQDDGLAFVSAAFGCSIAAIDLATGERSQLSDSSVPPGCYWARVLAYDDVRDRLVVRFGHDVEGGAYEGPYVIDMATGNFTRIPLDDVVPGGLGEWRALTMDPHGQNLVVTSADLHALLAIEPVSGQTVVLSR